MAMQTTSTTTYDAGVPPAPPEAHQRAEGGCIRLTAAGRTALEAVMIETDEISAERALDHLLFERAGQILVGQIHRKLAEQKEA